MSWLSIYSCLIRAVIFWPCPLFPVLVLPSRLSSPDLLFWPPRPSTLVPALKSPPPPILIILPGSDHPVISVLSPMLCLDSLPRLYYPGCPVLNVLSRFHCPSSPIPACLHLLSCSCCPVLCCFYMAALRASKQVNSPTIRL
jgi:hypothetical protein